MGKKYWKRLLLFFFFFYKNHAEQNLPKVQLKQVTY